MANTIIQIKRSSVTAAPTGGSLATAEQAYSFLSNKLFIGDSSGTGVIPIGGKFYVDQQNTIFDLANAAYNAANSAGSLAVINLIFGTANAAFDKANTVASDLANTAVAANNYAGAMANAANNYAGATFLPLTGGTLTSDLNITGNLFVNGTTTYVNTATLLVSDNIFVLNSDLTNLDTPTQDAGIEINRGSATNVSILWNEASDKWTFTNNGTTYLNIASNTDLESISAGSNAYTDLVGTSANNYAGFMANAANAYAGTVGTSANAYADLVGASANNYAGFMANSSNGYAVTVGTSSNAYADLVGTAANINASNGSYISTGVVKVPYGGTGLTTFTQNGILFGNTAGDLKVTAAGTEGQVLQANFSGVPIFGHLDGGAF